VYRLQGLQRICPTGCFDIEGFKAEGAKILRPNKFGLDPGRCTFCRAVVESARRGIRFSKEFRMTSVEKPGCALRPAGDVRGGSGAPKHLCGGCLP